MTQLPTPVPVPPHFRTKCVEDGRTLETNREVVYPGSKPWTYTCAEHADRFRDRFASPFDQYKTRRGETFTPVGSKLVNEGSDDEVVLFTIRFADGVEIEAWPVEVVEGDDDGQIEAWWFDPAGDPEAGR